MICEKTFTALPPFVLETDCPVDRAKTLMESAAKNSCGHCVLCREGTLQIFEILCDATSGRGNEDDLELIAELCEVIEGAASCEMSRQAASECLSLIREYSDQFDKHIRRKRCPNQVCPAYRQVPPPGEGADGGRRRRRRG